MRQLPQYVQNGPPSNRARCSAMDSKRVVAVALFIAYGINKIIVLVISLKTEGLVSPLY